MAATATTTSIVERGGRHLPGVDRPRGSAEIRESVGSQLTWTSRVPAGILEMDRHQQVRAFPTPPDPLPPSPAGEGLGGAALEVILGSVGEGDRRTQTTVATSDRVAAREAHGLIATFRVTVVTSTDGIDGRTTEGPSETTGTIASAGMGLPEQSLVSTAALLTEKALANLRSLRPLALTKAPDIQTAPLVWMGGTKQRAVCLDR